MSCQTSQKVPILSISKTWVHVMTFCLNVLPEALPAGQERRSARWSATSEDSFCLSLQGKYFQMTSSLKDFFATKEKLEANQKLRPRFYLAQKPSLAL